MSINQTRSFREEFPKLEYRSREMPAFNRTTYYKDLKDSNEYNMAISHVLTGQNPYKLRNVQQFAIRPDKIEELPPKRYRIDVIEKLRKDMEGLSPFRKLDCPDFIDDFYINPLSLKNDLIGIGISDKCYLKPINDNRIHLLESPETATYVTAVELGGKNLTYVGRFPNPANQDGVPVIEEYSSDFRRNRTVNATKKVNKLLESKDSPNLLFSAGNSGTVSALDFRQPNSSIAWSHSSDESAICSLLEFDDHKLAIGLNSDQVKIWDLRQIRPDNCLSLLHEAAVKAMASSPKYPHLLATGSGTADRNIRIWNTNTGACLSSIYTGSQVCQLFWNQKGNQLLSTHGRGETNNKYIKLWHYNNINHKISPIHELEGHTNRVTYAAMNKGVLASVQPAEAVQTDEEVQPDGEILCLWNIPNEETRIRDNLEMTQEQHHTQTINSLTQSNPRLYRL